MHRNMSQQRDISDRRRPLTDYRAELKSPYCRPTANQYDQDKRMRREIANSNERRRMQSINNGFTVLRKKLPSQHQEEKLSKANILQQTSEYITKLEDEVRVLSNQLKQYAFRHPDNPSSRKRKNLDRNGGLRDDDYYTALQDEKLQLQCRLEEEMDRCRDLSRRVAELEKAAASYNKSLAITPGVEVRAVSTTSKPAPQKVQQTPKQVQPHRITTATPIIGMSSVPSVPATAVTATKASSVIATTPVASAAQSAVVSDQVVSSQPATIVHVRDSPEPPAKRAAPYHGLHQLILAADHVEKERHQVRTVSRVTSTSGGQLVVKGEAQDGQLLTSNSSSGKNLQHLQLVQLVAANSQPEGNSGTATLVSSSNTGSSVNTTTTVSNSPSSQHTASIGSSSGPTSQLIHIVPAGQDISSSAHVLHLVTTRSGKVGSIQEQKSTSQQQQQQQQQTQPQQEQREQQATPQQVLRIVPQVRLQTASAASSVKVEGGTSTVLDQLTSKLNVTADIGPQFTLVMRRGHASSSSQPVLGTTVSTATANSESITPTSQSVSSQVLDPPTS